jgi:ketosteroid isomerase-like protein
VKKWSNLDLVRSIYADWEDGDFSSTEWAPPEIEYVRADGPTPGRWTGLQGMAEGVRDFLSAWEGFRFEVEECRELDGARVLALMHFSARGKTSGVDVGDAWNKGASVFYIRDGKVTRMVFYFDRERPFADLGLASEADSP